MAKNKICGIYKITSPSGKIYIGVSEDIEARRKHYQTLHCKQQKAIYSSLKKYGFENHLFEIVEECLPTELNEKEQHYILFFNTFNSTHGMNLTSGGKHHRLSEESKRKLSLSKTGVKCKVPKSEAYRKAISLRNKGKIMSPETRAKLSASKLGKKNPNVVGEKNGMFGKAHTDEAKAKMSATRKGKVAPGRIYAKGENHAHFGCKHSEAAKLKMSIANSGINSPCYGRLGKLHPMSKAVIQMDLEGTEKQKWDSIADIYRALGFCKSAIAGVCRGKQKTSNGFKWKYYEPVTEPKA